MSKYFHKPQNLIIMKYICSIEKRVIYDDHVWMTFVESGWNVWVWLVGVVSRRRVWLAGEGGIYGCGCKEVYRFPHTTYPYSSCICSFFAVASLLFVHFLNVFRSCSSTFS